MSIETNLNKEQGTNAPRQAVPPSASFSNPRAGKARTGILLWLLGVPIPLILLILLIRSCM